MLSEITLTLEGPGGPSSVELSMSECVDLAEAVAASGRVAAVATDTTYTATDTTATDTVEELAPQAVRLDRVLLERFPAGSAVSRWAAAVTKREGVETSSRAGSVLASTVVQGGAGGDSSVNMLVLTALRSSLATSSSRPPSAAGRLLLQLVDLAAIACGQRVGFERAVVEARIESIKQLAYGAGHEINNPLANIATRAQSLLPAERDPERRRRLAAIIDQAFRARDMIGALMLFARPPKPVRREAAAQAIVAAAVEAVEAAARGRGVRVVVDAEEQRLLGAWDSGQLEEAVRAVLMNAIEASRGGGEVRVFVAKDAGDPAACRLRVVDDGTGMDRETLARAFDPFFSGREAGRGIGLGLSKVWRLVEINGGRTAIESRFGVGTTVSILLPMSNGAEPAIPRKVDASSPV